MTLSPIIERELRCGLRKDDARKLRMRFALIGAYITAIVLIGSSGNVAAFGRRMHAFLFILGLYIALAQTASLTAGLISRERHSQTLGLLFLAGLRPIEVFFGKLMSGAMLSLYNLLALAPFMALPFLSGGLSWQLFTATVICLPNLLFFALAVSILCSTLCQDEGAALILTMIAGGIVMGMTPALFLADNFFSNAKAVSPVWLLVSPGFGPYMILHNFVAGSFSDFWINSAVTVAWSLLALGVASATLSRTWQDDHETTCFSHWMTNCRAWLKGTSQWRRKMAGRWLESNPFTWLALQDRTLERIAWGVVLGIVAAWMAAWCLWPRRWLSIPNFFITVMLMNVTVEYIALYSAGRRIGDDRRSGALELLLTSRLDVYEIVEDQLRALRLQFQPVFWTIFCLSLVMMTGGFFLRDWPGLSAYVYLIVWTPVLLWSWRRSFHFCLINMWASLNCGRPAYALWRIAGNSKIVILMPMFLSFGSLISSFRNFPTGSLEELPIVGMWAIFLSLHIMGKRTKADQTMTLLWQEFRSIAEVPVPEPTDPRLQSWTIEERLDGRFIWREFVLGPRWKGLIRIAARAIVERRMRYLSGRPK